MDRRWVLLGVIAVLVVAGVVLFGLRSPEREELAEGEERFLLPIEPVGIVQSSPEEIRWRPVPGAREYRVEVFDGSGKPLWKGESASSSLPFPEEILVRVKEGERLHYRITARGGFGKELVSSEITFFRYLAAGG